MVVLNYKLLEKKLRMPLTYGGMEVEFKEGFIDSSFSTFFHF